MSAPERVDWSRIGPGRILLRMPNWLGDAVFALPTLLALGRQAGQARIELLARPALAGILAALELPGTPVRAGGAAGLAGLRADAARYLGARAALLLPNSLGSALPPWLAGVPVRVGAGRQGRSALLTHPTAPDPRRHQAAYYLEAAGLDPEPHPGLRLRASAGALAAAARDCPPGSFAVLAPGAAFGAAKRWPARRFAELGQRLAALGLEVLVLGTGAEAALCGAIAADTGGRSLAGQTDGDRLVGLLASARLVVANDSGALHLAAALGTPSLGLYGATDPRATGPLGRSAAVLHHGAPCSPCGLRECNQPSHLCMEAVSVEQALGAARERLAPARQAAAV